MSGQRIGIGGTKSGVDFVARELRARTDLVVVKQPSLLGKTSLPTMIRKLWGYAGDVDLYYGISYGQWPRYLLAKLRGKATICQWMGTDVWRVMHEPLYRRWFLTFIKPSIDRHLAVSETLADELRPFGVRAEIIPVLSSTISASVRPLPEAFTVLAYLPDGLDTLYGADTVYAIAERQPGWRVLIVGREPTARGRSLSNVQELGTGVNMEELYPEVSVLLRPTIHDGLPRMLLEALSWGRYVVFSRPFPYCEQARTPDEAEKALEELKKKHDTPNVGGAHYIRETYTVEKMVSSLQRVIEDVLERNR